MISVILQNKYKKKMELVHYVQLVKYLQGNIYVLFQDVEKVKLEKTLSV